MVAGGRKTKSVSQYINAAPPMARKRLREMRRCIRSAAPGAREGIKWGMPSFSYKRVLVMYAAFRDHVSLFPTSSPIRALAAELRRYRPSKGTIRFPLNRPVPRGLIRRVTAFCVRGARERDAKWRA